MTSSHLYEANLATAQEVLSGPLAGPCQVIPKMPIYQGRWDYLRAGLEATMNTRAKVGPFQDAS
jgi:hypothetical protein